MSWLNALELLRLLRGLVAVQHAGDDLARRGRELAGVNGAGSCRRSRENRLP